MITGILKYALRSLHIVPWWIVFPNQLGLLPKRPDKRQVRLRKGGRFWIRPNTRDINEVLAVGLGYEYPSRLFSELALFEEVVLLDCGAHIGTFAVYASRLVSENTIVSFEPEQSNYALLNENIALNALGDSVRICRAAIAPFDGSVRLHLNKNNNGHSLIGADTDAEHIQEIPGYSLATIVREYCGRRPYALKLDIEGAEYDVLAAARTEIARAVFVIMEWHVISTTKENHWQWLTQYFEELGFIGECLGQSSWGGVAIWRKRCVAPNQQMVESV